MLSNTYSGDELINKSKEWIINISEGRQELMFGKSCEGAFCYLGSVLITMFMITVIGFVMNKKLYVCLINFAIFHNKLAKNCRKI